MNLKELAALLKLSPTTVSRALNGYPEVSEATRRRVLAAAREHNYAPNSFAKQLATGRSHAIGHVVPLSAHEMINPHFSDFISGAGRVYSRLGYDMVISVVPDTEEEATYRKMASRRSVDGVVIHGPVAGDRRYDILREIGLPFVVHGRFPEHMDGYSWLDVNNKRAFRRATDFLLDLGHRRIALLNGLDHMSFAIRRRMGYEEALTARGVAVDPALVFSEEMVEPYGHARGTQLLRSAAPPSAILCSSIIVALGVARAARDLGLRLGEDLSVITHDDELSFLQAQSDVPMFTSTRSSMQAAGSRAAEMLIAKIQDPGLPETHELWEAVLTVGGSTGPAPQTR
ncbi:LacI family DNA-binding transcriptional regulator [Oceanomicrobium pacificus]|uniref:Substrate-binding domain-containing protein n=1 Tax=Oceanomicrobium pacificus TaxID=2692916 RepID=A0A6B0TSK1_9RHOB|nr:substrate-binding domain-containing protein [Oceanomicrobium pacificus]MXU64182.1 substrate-binding domain-containing protein [Oceanomicrobium pacificus]